MNHQHTRSAEQVRAAFVREPWNACVATTAQHEADFDRKLTTVTASPAVPLPSPGELVQVTADAYC